MLPESVKADLQRINAKRAVDSCYKRHKRENALSSKKRRAIQLLIHGHSDQHVADTLKVHRTTITRWRLYHPTFQTELNRQRQSMWANHSDRLRSMMSKALDTLQSHMDSTTERASFRAAVSIIRLGARMSLPSGPTDEYELLKQHLYHEHHEREKYEEKYLSWPIPKEDLDHLREYLICKSANLPLPPPPPDPRRQPPSSPADHPSSGQLP